MAAFATSSRRISGLVREAKREQSLMLNRLCPHLVTPIPFLYPAATATHGSASTSAPASSCTTSSAAAAPCHDTATSPGAAHSAQFPSLAPKGLAGGIQYWDALVDDARHTLTLARTAALHGVALATSTRAVDFLRAGQPRHRRPRSVPRIGARDSTSQPSA